jgi:hypothetical protein
LCYLVTARLVLEDGEFLAVTRKPAYAT